eukprot:symbB.v1.2.035879.t1/scaffold4937.1/size32646/1
MFCNKCKQVPPREGDTWCLACSAWESIGISLTGWWGSAGLRGSAAEAVVGTARVLKSLRDIDAGLVARAKSEASRPRSLAVKEEEEDTEKKRDRSRSPLIRAKSAAPAVPEREKEEYSEGSESEEGCGEEAPTVPAESAVDGRRGHLRPAEPAFPPTNPRGEEAAERDQGDRDRDRRREDRTHKRKKEDKETRQRKRRRSNRGGRKHKRLSRKDDNRRFRMGGNLGEPEWDALDVHRGDVIEVYMPSTDMVEPAEVWAGFLVMQVSVELGNQAMALEVKSLGPKAMPGRKEKKEAGQKDKGGVTPPPPAAVSKLKEKLASLKARLSGSEKPAPWDTVGDAGDGQCEVVSSEEEDYQPSPEKLDTGTEIIPFHKEKKKKESKSLNAVATRGTTMKGLQGQLANRALAAMDQHRSKKKEKKSPAKKSRRSNRQSLGGWQSQKGEEGQETQVEEGRQEEEEEEWGRPLELWGQQRFGRELRRIIHGPGQWVQRGVREPDEEEKPRSACSNSGDVGSACEGPVQ